MNNEQIFTALHGGSFAAVRALYTGADFSLPHAQDSLAALEKAAAQYLHTPTPSLSYTLFRLYWDTGDRVQYQAAYYERRGRLLTFALLAWAKPQNAQYLAALEDILWDICGEAFWCLPAHFMGLQDEDIPFEQYAQQLDLFACETGFAICEALQLCGDRLSERCRKQAELQVQSRILDAFLCPQKLHRFEQMPNNWAAVCAGAVGGVALLTVQNEAMLTHVLARVLSSIDVYLGSFGEDGICTEGVSYWTYGFGFLVCFADLLHRRTSGKLDLFALPKVRAIAHAQQHYYIAGNTTLSFADGWPETAYRIGLSAYLQQRYGDVPLPPPQYAMGVLGDSCYRFCLSLRDFLWLRADTVYGSGETQSVWLPNAQWFVSRGAFTVGAKAGNNGESHNHNDCGSFVLYRGGVPFVEDLGAGTYDAGTFGPQRYMRLIPSSRSHNVASFAGALQQAGAAYAAKNTRAVFEANADTFTTELQDCYAVPDLQLYRRRLINDRQRACCTVQNTFVLRRPTAVTETLLTHSEITLLPGKAVFTCAEGSVSVLFDAAHVCATQTQETYLDHTQTARTAHLLHLCAAPATAVEITYTIQ